MEEPDTTLVKWTAVPAETVQSPIVRRLPYLEVKLEHPTLEPTAYGDRFFPDAVPYELDGTPRTFYWRSALTDGSGEPSDWELLCATTHDLAGIDGFPARVPALVTEGDGGTTVVTEGTIAGDSTTCRVRSYEDPTVTLHGRSDTAVDLTVAGDEYHIAAGERRRIDLPERRVVPRAEEGGETTVTPELAVRYPGRRELHHPATDATYRLFPSFGLDVDTIANPLSVPTVNDDLDDDALARALGVDLSRRPYPERVLWQAFAYSAFDPRSDTSPTLAQLDTGHIVLRDGSDD